VLAQCQSAAAFDGRWLYMAGPGTIIRGKHYRGSIERMAPATGAIVWQTGLPEGVLTSPAVNAGGVITVGTYDKRHRGQRHLPGECLRRARSCGTRTGAWISRRPPRGRLGTRRASRAVRGGP
jgi:hypothetical protein